MKEIDSISTSFNGSEGHFTFHGTVRRTSRGRGALNRAASCIFESILDTSRTGRRRATSRTPSLKYGLGGQPYRKEVENFAYSPLVQ